MEAMALGTPAIGTDIRGVRDLLGEGAGLVVPVRDPGAIRGAMQELVDSPELRRSIAANARMRVEGYALPQVLRQYELAYEGALGRAERRYRRSRPASLRRERPGQGA